MKISISITDTASAALDALARSLTGAEMADLNEGAGLAARDEAVAYHREFNAEGGWRGKRYLGAGAVSPGKFGADIAKGWHLSSFSANGAEISNSAPYYAFKVRGGTIVPKRARALTIPAIREAKGLFARTYEQNTGRKLFMSRNKNALLERTDETITGRRGRRNTPSSGNTLIKRNPVRVVYWLVKSVTQAPTKGAMPPEKRIADAYTEAWEEGLEDIIKTL